MIVQNRQFFRGDPKLNRNDLRLPVAGKRDLSGIGPAFHVFRRFDADAVAVTLIGLEIPFPRGHEMVGTGEMFPRGIGCEPVRHDKGNRGSGEALEFDLCRGVLQLAEGPEQDHAHAVLSGRGQQPDRNILLGNLRHGVEKDEFAGIGLGKNGIIPGISGEVDREQFPQVFFGRRRLIPEFIEDLPPGCLHPGKMFLRFFVLGRINRHVVQRDIIAASGGDPDIDLAVVCRCFRGQILDIRRHVNIVDFFGFLRLTVQIEKTLLVAAVEIPFQLLVHIELSLKGTAESVEPAHGVGGADSNHDFILARLDFDLHFRCGFFADHRPVHHQRIQRLAEPVGIASRRSDPAEGRVFSGPVDDDRIRRGGSVRRTEVKDFQCGRRRRGLFTLFQLDGIGAEPVVIAAVVRVRAQIVDRRDQIAFADFEFGLHFPEREARPITVRNFAFLQLQRNSRQSQRFPSPAVDPVLAFIDSVEIKRKVVRLVFHLHFDRHCVPGDGRRPRILDFAVRPGDCEDDGVRGVSIGRGQFAELDPARNEHPQLERSFHRLPGKVRTRHFENGKRVESGTDHEPVGCRAEIR